MWVDHEYFILDQLRSQVAARILHLRFLSVAVCTMRNGSNCEWEGTGRFKLLQKFPKPNPVVLAAARQTRLE